MSLVRVWFGAFIPAYPLRVYRCRWSYFVYFEAVSETEGPTRLLSHTLPARNIRYARLFRWKDHFTIDRQHRFYIDKFSAR